MSSGRFPYPLVLALLIASGSAWAQETTGGEASSWTDPPARTAPQEPEKAPLAAPEAKGPAKGPDAKEPESARAERTPEPSRIEPSKTQPLKTEPTLAERRQEQIRRAVDRSTAEREAEARGVRVPQRSVVERPVARRSGARPQRFSERLAPRLRERQVVERQVVERPVPQRRSLRRPVYGYADPMPVGPVDSRYRGGPPVWDEGPGPDLRSRRIAQARSTGYLVMRSRSYAYPDGTVVRRFSPLGADDFDE